MATFTMELRTVAEQLNNDIGLSNYPLFDNNYRPQLNKRIKDHFWFREIGFETPDLFRHRLASRMNNIMPYYNELYKTTQHNMDPFKTVDIRTLSESENRAAGRSESESTSSSDSASKSRSVNSDFPQTMLSESGDYASSAVDSASESNAVGTSSDQGTTETDSSGQSDTHQTGYSGLVGSILSDYRAAILNIDVMVIADLEDLFMGVWNIDSPYTEDYGNVYPRFY